MNEQTNINVEKLRPFTRLLMTIGTLPTSYLMSMTYLEQVTWFCNYLQNVVIPTINNNAQAVEELQDIINNLDIQDEVDTKLDEMAESGQLTDIIAQYLDLAGVLAYNTINDMAVAENLTNGSICYCLGDVSYNDGKGAFYKIRNVTTSDTIDGFNIVAITNDNTIIGERLPNYYIDLINRDDTIFLGDSYAAGTTYEHGSVEYLTSWCEYLRQLMKLTSGHYYIYAQGNAGFAKIGNNSMNFQMTLNSHLDEITNKNEIKNIIVCGGYNDYDQETSLIHQRIGEFVTFCNENFPNAKVYIGMIGGNASVSTTGRDIRKNLLTKVYNAYVRCNEFGAIYLSGVENFSHNFYQFNTSGNHPNESGYKYIANMIYNALKGGYAPLSEPIVGSNLTTNFNNYLSISGIMSNGIKTIFVENWFANNIDVQNITDEMEIVPSSNNTLTKLILPCNNENIKIPCNIAITDGNNVRHYTAGNIVIKSDGSITLSCVLFAFVHSVKFVAIWSTPASFQMMLS